MNNKRFWHGFLIFTVVTSVVTIASAQDIPCGVNGGDTCPTGMCCSSNGFCGTTTEYCGPGCDKSFGTCTAYECGVRNGTPCPTGLCCGKDGYCGNSKKHCGADCDLRYGRCKDTSTNGLCGVQNGKSCPSGQCCSKFGFCGITEPQCNEQCDPKFGRCNGKDGPGFKPGSVHGTCQVPNSFSVTFDDGPSQFTEQLLEKLGDEKVSFFINGNNWGCIYDYADALVHAKNAGHLIGSHTWSHPALSQQSDKEIKYQFLKLNEAMYKITGCRFKYMRPPFGNLDQRVIDIASDLDMQLFIWDVDSGDTTGKTLQQQEDFITDFMSKNPSPTPHIILSHDVIQSTAETLSFFMLDEVKKGGWQQMSMGQCFNDDPSNWYVCDRKPTPRDDTWKCSPNDRNLTAGGTLEFEVSKQILEGKAKGYPDGPTTIEDNGGAKAAVDKPQAGPLTAEEKPKKPRESRTKGGKKTKRADPKKVTSEGGARTRGKTRRTHQR